MNSLPYIAIVLLILVSAFFSASEIALSSVNVRRLKTRSEEKSTPALKSAITLLDNYDAHLGAILIGNNIANTAASSIATVIVMGLLGENYAWVSTLCMTLLVLTFGEIIPKVLAKEFPEKMSIFAAIPIRVLNIILYPLLAIIMWIVNLTSKIWEGNESNVDSVSEEDFENIIDIVEEEGVIDEEQCDLLQNALDFDEVLAHEIITHRVDMEALDIRDPYEKNVEKIMESTYSRLPVYEDTTDNIIGVLHLNHFYKQLIDKKKVNIRELMLPVTFVHKTMPLDDVLEKMKKNKAHLVIVRDEYGGTMGLLTMEDVLEQLVGEIFDENDEIEREFVCIEDNLFEVDGDMRIYDFFDEFDIDIEEDENFEDDNATVGGWVITELDGEVNEGDTLTYKNLTVTVKETDGFRVQKILVREEEIDEDEEE